MTIGARLLKTSKVTWGILNFKLKAVGSPSCFYLPLCEMQQSLLQGPLDTAGTATKLAHVIMNCIIEAYHLNQGSEETILRPQKLNTVVCWLLSKQTCLDCLSAIQNTWFTENPDYEVNQAKPGHIFDLSCHPPKAPLSPGPSSCALASLFCPSLCGPDLTNPLPSVVRSLLCL